MAIQHARDDCVATDLYIRAQSVAVDEGAMRVFPLTKFKVHTSDVYEAGTDKLVLVGVAWSRIEDRARGIA